MRGALVLLLLAAAPLAGEGVGAATARSGPPVGSSVRPASADTTGPGFCFRPTALPRCRWSPLTEMQAGAVFAQGDRTRVAPGGGRVTESLGLDGELSWRLGVLVNLDPRWAVGATADFTTWRRDQPLAGVDLRVRRWFDGGWAVDGELRVVRHDEGLLFQQQDAATLGLGLRASWRDFFGVWVRADLVDVPPAEVDLGDATVSVDGGRKAILLGGASLGREAGVLATVVYVAALYAFFATGSFQ